MEGKPNIAVMTDLALGRGLVMIPFEYLNNSERWINYPLVECSDLLVVTQLLSSDIVFGSKVFALAICLVDAILQAQRLELLSILYTLALIPFYCSLSESTRQCRD